MVTLYLISVAVANQEERNHAGFEARVIVAKGKRKAETEK
jgi:hypothetical protein